MFDFIRSGIALGIRDYRLEFRGSFIGSAWGILSPFLYAVLFITYKANVAEASRVITGILCYQVWFETFICFLSSFVRSKDLITRVRVEPEVIFISSLSKSILAAVLKFLALVVISVSFFDMDIFYYLRALFVISYCVFCGASFGWLLVPISSVYRDVLKLVSSLSIFFLFASGALGDGGQLFFHTIFPIRSAISLLSISQNSNEFVLAAFSAWLVVNILVLFVSLRVVRKLYGFILDKIN